MLQDKFKEGDCVTYMKHSDSEDTGIVVRVDGSIYHESCTDQIWVKWSSGRILWAKYSALELIEDHKNTEILTIETCLEFLASKGFEVTLKSQNSIQLSIDTKLNF